MISILCEYVWCSGSNTHHDLRSKCKTLKGSITADQLTLADIPHWDFDGSSTGQALGNDTEIILKPVAIFPHPFVDDIPSRVILCECYYPNGEPTRDNTRHIAADLFSRQVSIDSDPWYGMEQEYVLTQHNIPYGWPKDREPPSQGPYFCSNGPSYAWGRYYAMSHYKLCLKMGLLISGINAEVMPGQWEYQIGPCHGIDMGDQLLISRWVYLRLLEQSTENNLDINFEVKPRKGNWNGSGLHTNYSTNDTRKQGGLEVLKNYMVYLENTRANDICLYSETNNERLLGTHETSSLNQFTWGIGTRNTSCRIPNSVNKAGMGYLEDRRPGADADPYLISASMFKSTMNLNCPELDNYAVKLRKDWMH